MIAASGGCTAARSSASSRGRGRHDVEARVAQHDAQRAQDLRLVVADEHAPGRGGHAGTASASGSATTKLDPWPGSDSTRTWPPFASTKPLHDRQPEPGSLGAPVAAAEERLEDPLLVGGRDAGPAVDHAHEQPSAADARADGDRLAVGVAAGVLQQVRERALELGAVGEDQREVAVDRQLQPVRARGPRTWPPRAAAPPPSTSRGAARRRRPAGARARSACRRAARAGRSRWSRRRRARAGRRPRARARRAPRRTWRSP